MTTRKQVLEEHDVAIYLRVRGENAKDVDSLVYKFCSGLKKKLGPRLVIRSVDADK